MAIVIPRVEPITLAEARLQCRIDSDDTSRDLLLEGLITAAREYAEHFTGRGLTSASRQTALDGFPGADDPIELDFPPVTSITSIQYTDTAGDVQTLDPSAYVLGQWGYARRLSPAFGTSWPQTQDSPDSVRITYLAGYADLPPALKQALLIDIQMNFDALQPADRLSYERARDSLLATKKIWGL